MGAPAPPPEAVLLRVARKAAGITIAEAAKAVGVSKAWLSTIETGSESRDGVVRPVQARDDVAARLAALYKISPERLETEGGRADAAAVLREMQRAGGQGVRETLQGAYQALIAADPHLGSVPDRREPPDPDVLAGLLAMVDGEPTPGEIEMAEDLARIRDLDDGLRRGTFAVSRVLLRRVAAEVQEAQRRGA